MVIIKKGKKTIMSINKSDKKSSSGKPYSPKDNNIILDMLHKGHIWKDIAIKLGRSGKSVSRHYNKNLKNEKEKTHILNRNIKYSDQNEMKNIVNIVKNQNSEIKKYNFTILMDNNVLCSHILKYGNTLKDKDHCIGYSYGNKQDNFNIELMLPYGKHFIHFRNKKITIISNTYFEPMSKYDSIDFYKQVIVCSNESFEILEEFIRAAKEYCETGGTDKVTCYIMTHGVWRKLSSQKKRHLNTIYLEQEIIDNLCKDIEKFLSSEEKYEKLGIPYKRNYLFEGVPGTGKTSLILSLASKYDMNVGIISLNKELDDYTFMKSISNIPKNTLLVLEDIDGLFDEDKQNSLTFSGVLNTLDGLGRQDKLIIIMTTNHLNKLNNSLKRAGRIDYRIHFDYSNKKQIKLMMEKFFEDKDVDIDKFIKNINNIKLTPSILQYFIQKIMVDNCQDIASKENISLLRSISKEFLEDFAENMYI
jgi:hypothetical protein